jgi:DHA2 family multidrug resistance protein
MASHLDPSWTGSSFFVPELVLAVGLAAGFVGLVVNLLVLALEMGALASPVNAATFSGTMHTMRLLGGQIGAVVFARFLTVREHFHSNLLGLNVDPGSWLTTERLGGLTAALASSSSGLQEAQARSVGLLSSQVRAQAYTMACSDAFLLIAWAVVGYLVLLLFLRPGTISLRPKKSS